MTPEQKAAEIKRLAAIINSLVEFTHVLKWPPKKAGDIASTLKG